MRLYALTELHDPEAIELFITRRTRAARLRIVCGTSPSGAAGLEVTEVELDHEHTSLN